MTLPRTVPRLGVLTMAKHDLFVLLWYQLTEEKANLLPGSAFSVSINNNPRQPMSKLKSQTFTGAC